MSLRLQTELDLVLKYKVPLWPLSHPSLRCTINNLLDIHQELYPFLILSKAPNSSPVNKPDTVSSTGWWGGQTYMQTIAVE